MLLGYTGNLFKMCEIRCHTEQNVTPHTWWGPPLGPVGATFRTPHLMDLMSSVILLHVINTVVTV